MACGRRDRSARVRLIPEARKDFFESSCLQTFVIEFSPHNCLRLAEALKAFCICHLQHIVAQDSTYVLTNPSTISGSGFVCLNTVSTSMLRSNLFASRSWLLSLRNCLHSGFSPLFLQLMSKRLGTLQDREYAVVLVCFTATSFGQRPNDSDIRRARQGRATVTGLTADRAIE